MGQAYRVRQARAITLRERKAVSADEDRDERQSGA